MNPGVFRLHNPLCAIVWLAMFVPGHAFGGRLGPVLPVATLILGGVILFTQPALWGVRRPTREAAAVFLLILLIDAASYAYSAAFNGVRSGPMDLWALSKPLFAGVLTACLIRHHDASVRKSLELALLGAVYITLVLRTTGIWSWSLFEPVQSMGYVGTLAAIHFVFFSRAPLRLAHAAASATVVLFCIPPGLESSREALEMFRRSPVFGWGPAYYEPVSVLGNQYLRWLLRSGVLGTGLIIIGLSIVCFRLLRDAWGDRRRLLGSAIFIGFTAGMLLTGAFLEDFRLFALTAFLIAGMHSGGAA